ncbi:hypothetical protein IGI67_003288 [Enterococcus sp. AZ196]
MNKSGQHLNKSRWLNYAIVFLVAIVIALNSIYFPFKQ